MSRLIAFTGLAGSGKTTAANALLYDAKGWERVKFATPLKAMLRAFYDACGLDPFQIEDRIEGTMKEMADPALCGRTPRHAMQTLGTEWGRDRIAADLWVQAWQSKTKQLLDEGVNVVCDDCRYPNEAKAVRALGGKVVRIIGRGGIASKHESEKPLPPDFQVENQGDIDIFRKRITYLFGVGPV